MTTHAENKIALLIDGDNASSKFIESILSEAGKYGKVTVRRIYGDWTDTRLNGWKEQINKYSIRPMQKFAFARGKNSTDTAMIIDAMDILHSNAVTGFCIASSDSDYTGLAQRIREQGVFVMGIGEAKKTTDAFVNACDIFIYTENLISVAEQEIKKDSEKTKTEKGKTEEAKAEQDNPPQLPDIKITGKIDLPQSKITKKPIDLKFLMNGFDMVVDDTGLAYMGEIGVALRKLDPSFDSRTYGFSSMTALFKSLSGLFELVYKDNGTSLFIKLKKQK
ncbi:MAG: NYN domain-containing protein [Bacteroidetes bacterium]|nr:NYN domain-containing protein [Bacteroidota bacterium]